VVGRAVVRRGGLGLVGAEAVEEAAVLEPDLDRAGAAVAPGVAPARLQRRCALEYQRAVLAVGEPVGHRREARRAAEAADPAVAHVLDLPLDRPEALERFEPHVPSLVLRPRAV
jgi:hypothetical protein